MGLLARGPTRYFVLEHTALGHLKRLSRTIDGCARSVSRLQYHLAMARVENAVRVLTLACCTPHDLYAKRLVASLPFVVQTHAFVVQTRDRMLCTPVPPANISAWDARPLNTRVRPVAFDRALAAAACARSDYTRPSGDPTWSIPLRAVAPFAYSMLHSAIIDN